MFVHVLEGNSPVVITVPHDGTLRFPGIQEREQVRFWRTTRNPDRRDERTLPIALRIRQRLSETGHAPTVIWVSAERGYVDVNRRPNNNPHVPSFRDTYLAFHREVDEALAKAFNRHGRAVHVDLHGFVNRPGRGPYNAIFGTQSGFTSQDGSDERLAAELRRFGHEVVFSPDPDLGVDGRWVGGWVVTRVGDAWHNRPVDSMQVELDATLRKPARVLTTGDELALALQRTLAA